jgi:hypothetical protein
MQTTFENYLILISLETSLRTHYRNEDIWLPKIRASGAVRIQRAEDFQT